MKPAIAICAVIALLTGCNRYPESSNFSANEHDEITDIADSAIDGAMEDHDKVRALEDRVAELEQRLDAKGI